MDAEGEGGTITDGEILRAIFALLLEERDERVNGDKDAPRVELLLSGVGLGYRAISSLVDKSPDAVRMAISRGGK